MAQPIQCDGPDLEVALYIITNQDTGDILAFCVSCFADFCQAYLTAVAPDRLAPPPAPKARKRRTAAAGAAAADANGGESVGTAPAAPAG